MINLRWQNRTTPIGVDLGARSVKLVQMSADQKHLIEAVRWDLPPVDEKTSAGERANALAEAIKQARCNRKFRGRDAVVCLGRNELFLQNLRVPQVDGLELERLVQQEAAGRLPFSVTEAEIRFLQAADIRHGDSALREVILCACHRPVLNQMLTVIEQADLRPVAVDIQSNALLRSYIRQYRRDEDQQKQSLLVHVGHSATAVVIAEGDHTLFVKYIDIGGGDLDQAVADHLQMEPHEAAALRRHNGDRRADQQDPEVGQSIADATRGVLENLISELSHCIRYHSVTFRGKPLMRLVLGGGEASDTLCDTLSRRLELKCDLCDPLREFANQTRTHRQGQWDVATGLALRGAD